MSKLDPEIEKQINSVFENDDYAVESHKSLNSSVYKSSALFPKYGKSQKGVKGFKPRPSALDDVIDSILGKE